MSKLTRLRLKGIRSFGAEDGDQQDIVFFLPVTLFLGQSGCGKTTIIDAMKYAITGDLQSDGQGFLYDPKLAKQVETQGTVKLKITDVKGDSLILTKISSIEQDDVKQTFKNITTKISRGKTILSDKCVDVHKLMCSLLGVSKIVLNKVVFCHQEDSYWPSEPTKLKERFGAIFGSTKLYDCVTNLIGVREKKLEEIKTLKNDVESKRFYKIQMELKRDQLKHKKKRNIELLEYVKEISNSIELTQKNINGLSSLEKEINVLLKDKEQLEYQIRNTEEEQNLISSNINCFNDELNRQILFESDKALQNKIKILEDNKKEIDTKESNLRNKMNKEEIRFGKLLRQQEENHLEINTRNKLINECILDFDLIVISTSNTADTINDFKKSLKTFETELENLEFCFDIEEKKLQTEIDDYRTRYTYLKQVSATKFIQTLELKIECDKLIERINVCNSSSDELEHVKSKITSNELKITDLGSNISKLQEEIQSDKNKLFKTEQRFEAVENEIEINQKFCSIKTEIDLLNENLHKTQKRKEIIMLKNEEWVKKMFGDVSLDSLNIDAYLTKQIKFVNRVSTGIKSKEKTLSGLEVDINLQKEQLQIMRRFIEKEGSEITEIFHDSSYEEVESETMKTMEDLVYKKAVNVNKIEIYSTYLESFKVPNPSCPLCMKEIKEKTIIDEIAKKIPEDEKNTELDDIIKKYSKICELKLTYQKVREHKNAVSVLIEKISQLEINARQTKEVINFLRNSIKTPLNHIDIARKLPSDIDVINQYDYEITQTQEKIISLSKQLPMNETTRTAEEAFNERILFNSSLKKIRTKIQNGHDKLFKDLELLQLLKSRHYDLKEKEFALKINTSTKDLLEKQRNEIESKITIIENKITEIKSEIDLKNRELYNSLNNKETNKLKYRQEREELQSKIISFKKKINDIIRLENNINIFIQENIDEQISTTNKTLNKDNQNFLKLAEEKDNITKNIHELKNQILNFYNIQKLQEKNDLLVKLQDNLKLLEKNRKLDLNGVKSRFTLLTKNLNLLNLEMWKTQGQIKEIKNIISDYHKELSDPIYHDADINFKNAVREHKILLKAVEDVDTLIKAKNWTILETQKEQIATINNKIRIIWKSIYQGNDIDYIEIDEESYYIVQVKDDSKINMYGNCSTGQKALASLVIRFAFADAFSEKCGIFVLDEPTTNLDEKTVENLCVALADLIKYKKNQENFHLIIITLDTNFFNKLRHRLLIDMYYLVSKNKQGKSIITFKDDS